MTNMRCFWLNIAVAVPINLPFALMLYPQIWLLNLFAIGFAVGVAACSLADEVKNREADE